MSDHKSFFLNGASRCWAFLSSIWIEVKCEMSQAFFNFFAAKIKTNMEKYYLVYNPSDNEGIFISTNLELVKKECEESGVKYMEIPFYI